MHKPVFMWPDQCRAMEVAIAKEWKHTVHRWCKWHVLKRVNECLGSKYTSNKEFRDKFHLMLNEMLTVDEFEKGWAALLKQYGLEKNGFLQQIYETREKWVKSYFKGVFCARMTSTQRSESANHMLKNILSPGCTLHQFIQQYMKLQYIRDEEENYEERRNKLVRVETECSFFVELHKMLQLLYVYQFHLSLMVCSRCRIRRRSPLGARLWCMHTRFILLKYLHCSVS